MSEFTRAAASGSVHFSAHNLNSEKKLMMHATKDSEDASQTSHNSRKKHIAYCLYKRD